MIIEFTKHCYLWDVEFYELRNQIQDIKQWCKDNRIAYKMMYPYNYSVGSPNDYDLPNRISLSESDAVALRLSFAI